MEILTSGAIRRLQRLKQAMGRRAGDPARRNTRHNCFSLDQQGVLSIADGQVQRVVVDSLWESFRSFERSGTLARLVEAGLIPTWAETSTESTLSHKFLPFVTYPGEWTLTMLRDAALCTLRVAVELARAGHILHDGHPWNVSFSHGRAHFLDFSSIVCGGQYRSWFVQDFFRCFYVPMWLRSNRLYSLADMINREEHPLGGRAGARATGRFLFGRKGLGRLCWRYWQIADRLLASDKPQGPLEELLALVASTSIPLQRTEWSGYHSPGGAYGDPQADTAKAAAVRTLLQHVKPGRLVDVACNRGWFTGLASSMGFDALGLDIDENAVDGCRQNAASDAFDVACTNVLWPTPRQGMFLQLPDCFERWRADTVLMCALAHHIVLRQGVTFESLAEVPWSFGASHVIVEWIPRDDVHVRGWPSRLGVQISDWYTEANFVAAMSARYPRVQSVPSGEAATGEAGKRVMYLLSR